MGVKVNFILLMLFLIAHFGHSQKIVKKTLVNPSSKSFQIDVTNCYRVMLSTSKTDEIVISATIDGEYQKDILVTVEEDGSNVFIGTEFQPNFKGPNDKLSAHKVISISLDVSLPDFVTAHVFGTHSNVTAQGNYKKLKINLADGNCSLMKVGEEILVKTQKGTISLTVESGQVNAESNYGNVYREAIPPGNSLYDLHSVEGDIQIKRTE